MATNAYPSFDPFSLPETPTQKGGLAQFSMKGAGVGNSSGSIFPTVGGGTPQAPQMQPSAVNQGKSSLSWMQTTGTPGAGMGNVGSSMSAAYGTPGPGQVGAGTLKNYRLPGQGYTSDLQGGGGTAFGGGGFGTSSAGMGLLEGLANEDFDRQQGAADRQFARKDSLSQLAQSQYGKDQATLGKLQGDTEEDLDKAQAAREKALAEFQDTSAQDMSAMASGMAQRYASTMDALNARKSDELGMGVFSGETDSQIAQLQQEQRSQLFQALAPMASEFNKLATQLKLGNADSATANRQIKNATALSALNYLYQGREQMYQFVNQNPETIVSKLSTALALAGVGQAQGGGGWSAMTPLTPPTPQGQPAAPEMGEQQQGTPGQPRVDPNAGLANGSVRSGTGGGGMTNRENEAYGYRKYGLGGSAYR